MTKTTTKSKRRMARSPAAKLTPGAQQSPPAPNPPAETKIAIVTRLLRQETGASLDELVAATGWQPHTTRAAPSGLRKKGHTLAKDKVVGVTRYSITAATEA
jgi:hypothetical protein